MCMSGSIERRFEPPPGYGGGWEESVNRCRLTLRVRVHFFELFRIQVGKTIIRKGKNRRISQGKREEGEKRRD